MTLASVAQTPAELRALLETGGFQVTNGAAGQTRTSTLWEKHRTQESEEVFMGLFSLLMVGLVIFNAWN